MTDDALTGTWLLRSHQVENTRTGETSEPFGPSPSGVLIVLPDGRMSALITGAAAADTGAVPIVAYSGRARIAEPGVFVTAVDVAWIAAWVGTEQARRYTIDGDRLDLTTMPAGGDGPAAMVGHMVWVRETVASAGANA